MKNKKGLILLSLAITAISLVYIVDTIGRRVKMDLTQEGTYSLSSGSRSILKKLSGVVQVKLYYSKTAANKGTEGIRSFNNYFVYVRDLLNEFVAHSGNNLEFKVIDPRPDTKEEEDAVGYGLKKFQLTETETYIFGLVAVSETGVEKVIEFFDPKEQGQVEYKIAKLIYSVSHTLKKRLGVLSSLNVVSEEMSPYMAQMMRMQGRPVQESWIITTMLRDLYEVKKIAPGVEEIKDVETLVVIHPKNLPVQTLFAIDQFVLKGGRLLVLVDPLSVVDRPQNPMGMMGAPPSMNSSLNEILKKWGVILQEGKLAGDRNLAGRGQVNRFSPPSVLLPLLECNDSCATKDIISSGLEKLTLLYPGALSINASEGLKVEPILQTTAEGNTYEANPYEMNDPVGLLKKFQAGTEPVVVAARISGRFPSNYPEGLTYEKKTPAKDEKEKAKTESIKLEGISAATAESAVVVIADVDFVADQFAFRKSIFGLSTLNDNSSLFLNAIEALSGSNDLLSIRSKGKISRPFDVVQKIERQAEEKTKEKVESINQSIERFQEELAQLGSVANDNNIALLQNQGVRKKQDLEKKLLELKSDLREVKREGRERVERLGDLLQFLNTLLIPLGLIILAFITLTRKREKTL